MSKKTIPITLNLMVDKSSKRVVFAESNGHFVDILLSFLTLPLASILRLTSKPPLGSIHKLFESVESLSFDCFRSEACRSMLLQPLNSAAELFGSLPISYDSSFRQTSFRYACNDSSCSFNRLCFYAKALCDCGKLMDRKVQFVPDPKPGREEAFVFLQGSSEYLISDDLLVFQSSAKATIDLLAKNGIKQGSSLESVPVEVTVEKIIELLKRLLVSNTSLTGVFLGGHKDENFPIIKQPIHQNRNEIVGPTSSKKITVKLFLNKEMNTVLFAEGGTDFVDLLVSFLTYPMGSAFNKLVEQTGIHSVDNLYKSVETLRLANCIKDLKNQILLKPVLPPYFSLKNKLIKIDEQPVIEKYHIGPKSECHHYFFDKNRYGYFANVCSHNCSSGTKEWALTDPKLLSSNDSGAVDYMRSARYMITDDLVVKKLSPAMLVTKFLEDDVRGINEKNIEIGEHEALVLLRASISSKEVLTDAFLRGGVKKVS